eukprot:gene21164-biopygen23617
MGPQPHTYGRGRFFRGRARGPFFAAGRYNGPGGPLLQVPRGSPLPPQRARPTDNAPALQGGAAPLARGGSWGRRLQAWDTP